MSSTDHRAIHRSRHEHSSIRESRGEHFEVLGRQRLPLRRDLSFGLGFNPGVCQQFGVVPSFSAAKQFSRIPRGSSSGTIAGVRVSREKAVSLAARATAELKSDAILCYDRSMRAVRCHEGSVVVLDVRPPEGDGVRVKVASAGICGSDLHLLGSDLLGDVTLGHEISGLTPNGIPVALEPVSVCGVCPACVIGDTNLCVRGPTILHGAARDGGMAEEILIPESSLIRLPAGLEPRNACLTEPLGVVVHGLRIVRFPRETGRRVAILGAGPIGLCTVPAIMAAGIRPVLFARHEAQKSAGSRLGAEIGDKEDGFDLVVECAGTESALEEAITRCRPGGTVLMLGIYWDGMSVPGILLGLKEVRLVPSYLYGREGTVRDMDTAAALLASRPDLPDILITHRFPLDAAAEAFEVASNRKAGAIKVVLEP